MLRKKSEMTDVSTKAMTDANRETLTDEQIVTKRKLPTRKFLTAAGMILATGALAVASGAQSAPQTADPDKAKSDTAAQTQKAGDAAKKKAGDPDKKKETGAKATKAKKDTTKAPEKPADPDSAKK
jgi:hypothetical protein